MRVLYTKGLLERYVTENEIEDKEEIKKITEFAEAYFQAIKEEIYKGLVYKPNYNWGLFGLVKYKAKKRKRIDWGASRKAGKYVYHERDDLNGAKMSFKFQWDKRTEALKKRFKNIAWYRMRPSDIFRKELWDVIKEKDDDPYTDNFYVSRKLYTE